MCVVKKTPDEISYQKNPSVVPTQPEAAPSVGCSRTPALPEGKGKNPAPPPPESLLPSFWRLGASPSPRGGELDPCPVTTARFHDVRRREVDLYVALGFCLHLPPAPCSPNSPVYSPAEMRAPESWPEPAIPQAVTLRVSSEALRTFQGTGRTSLTHLPCTRKDSGLGARGPLANGTSLQSLQQKRLLQPSFSRQSPEAAPDLSRSPSEALTWLSPLPPRGPLSSGS